MITILPIILNKKFTPIGDLSSKKSFKCYLLIRRSPDEAFLRVQLSYLSFPF